MGDQALQAPRRKHVVSAEDVGLCITGNAIR